MTANDDDAAALLHDRMSVVPLPPSRLTATGLVTEGRRIQRRRRSIGVSAGALGVSALLALGVAGYLPVPDTDLAADTAGTSNGTANAAAECVAKRLPLPSGVNSAGVSAGSPNGRYLAGYRNADGQPFVALSWDGEKVRQIPVRGEATANGVNDNGMVVGDAFNGDVRSAWALVDGKVITLPTPAGYGAASALAVNKRGDVAGLVWRGKMQFPVVWRGAGASVKADVLSTPNGAGGSARGISDSGVVVGDYHTESQRLPYRWDAAGRGSALPMPAGVSRGAALQIRGDWVLGMGVAAAPSRSNSVLWNLRTGAATHLDDNTWTGAVNSRGQVVLVERAGPVLLRDPDGSQRQVAPKSPSKRIVALSEDGTRIAGDQEEKSISTPTWWTCKG